MLYPFIAAGVALCIFQYSALAGYYSFGRTVNKSFGDPNEKNIMLTEAILVPISGIVTDVDLALNIKHTCICDLQIYLISPAGTKTFINGYNVYNFKPNKEDFYWTVFDAESPFSIEGGRPPFAGLYRPNEPDSLTAFYGQQSYGVWRVEVVDRIYADTGIFKGVRLDFNITSAVSPQISSLPEPSTIILLVFPAIIRISKRKTKPR